MTYGEKMCLGFVVIFVLFCGVIAAGIAYDKSFTEKAYKLCMEFGMNATFTRNKFFCVNDAGQIFDINVLTKKGTNQ